MLYSSRKLDGSPSLNGRRPGDETSPPLLFSSDRSSSVLRLIRRRRRSPPDMMSPVIGVVSIWEGSDDMSASVRSSSWAASEWGDVGDDGRDQGALKGE